MRTIAAVILPTIIKISDEWYTLNILKDHQKFTYVHLFGLLQVFKSRIAK